MGRFGHRPRASRIEHWIVPRGEVGLTSPRAISLPSYPMPDRPGTNVRGRRSGLPEAAEGRSRRGAAPRASRRSQAWPQGERGGPKGGHPSLHPEQFGRLDTLSRGPGSGPGSLPAARPVRRRLGSGRLRRAAGRAGRGDEVRPVQGSTRISPTHRAARTGTSGAGHALGDRMGSGVASRSCAQWLRTRRGVGAWRTRSEIPCPRRPPIVSIRIEASVFRPGSRAAPGRTSETPTRTRRTGGPGTSLRGSCRDAEVRGPRVVPEDNSVVGDRGLQPIDGDPHVLYSFSTALTRPWQSNRRFGMAGIESRTPLIVSSRGPWLWAVATHAGRRGKV